MFCLVERSGSPARAGDSPVGEKQNTLKRHLSTIRHVKPGWNLRGPPRKAKYTSMTDSGTYRDWERRKEPREGSEIDPETACLQKVGARKGDGVPFV